MYNMGNVGLWHSLCNGRQPWGGIPSIRVAVNFTKQLEVTGPAELS